MREIGSEYWEVPVTEKGNYLFPESTQWYLSGRSALQAIIKDLRPYQCQSVAIPSWCCDSMVKPFIDAGIFVHFYPVYWQRDLVQEISLTNDILFLMDYFGYTTPLPDLTGYKGVVIRDLTHSIFSGIYLDADYYFGSLRKWCGVWTGGYAWAKDGHRLPTEQEDDNGYTALREQAMSLKARYIKRLLSEAEKTEPKRYLNLFTSAEEKLEKMGIAPADPRDIEVARCLDAVKLKTSRRQNAKVLMDAFHDWLIFPTLSSDDCPMFVPVVIPNGKRDALRRFLIQHEIYCPVHWPVTEFHQLNEKERQIYENELSLVCDQRYDKDDMHRIVDTINLFLRRE